MADSADAKQSIFHEADDQPGLEVADSTNKSKGFYEDGISDGLQVVPNQGVGGKEVVSGSSPPLDRRSSLNQPEAWHLPHQQQQQPLIQQKKQPVSADESEYDEKREAVPSSWTSRRYCGMRGKWLAILLATILVVVIAAVLGSVLGALFAANNSDGSRGGSASGSDSSVGSGGGSSGDSSQAVTGSRKALSQTGIAATFLDNKENSTLLTYYQDDSNRIIENVYVDGAWSSDTSSAAAVVANASSGSPLTAISYNYNGSTWRQVFFVADDTSLWSTKATAEGAWEPAERLKIEVAGSTTNISSTHLAQGPALAACYGYEHLEGIRVYYGDTGGYIQELGQFFNESVWYAFNQFNGSDASSGVGCDFYADPGNSRDELRAIMNVYYRASASNELQQSWWSYISNLGWNTGPTGAGASIGSGTAISVSADSDAGEYIFFQSSNGTVTRGVIDATVNEFDHFDNVGNAISGGRLASAHFPGGTLYMFQNSSDDTTIWVENWDSGGKLVTSQRLPGTGEA